jgi:hypothetical protein
VRYRYVLWSDKLLLLSLLVFFYAYSTFVRVAARAAIEGPDFTWSYYSGFRIDGSLAIAGGAGLLGHTSFLLTSAFVVVLLLCMGFRKPDRFFQVALLGWTSIGFGVGLWLTHQFGDSLTTDKRTLGLSGLSVLWTSLLPSFATWLLAVALAVRGRLRPRPEFTAGWAPVNYWLLGTFVAVMLAAAVVLNLGPQHGEADFHGTGVLYLAFFCFMLGISPWEAREQPLGLTAAAQSRIIGEMNLPSGEPGTLTIGKETA